MKRKLTKSRDNVVLTGTLAGIAEYIGIDPTIVRVLYVFLSLSLIGMPIVLYVVLAMLIPAADSNPAARANRPYGNDNPYYKKNDYRNVKSDHKPADKIDDEDWSDF